VSGAFAGEDPDNDSWRSTMQGSGAAQDTARMTGKLVRLGETQRVEVPITIDGRAAAALDGDTVLTAVLVNGGSLGRRDFADLPRAGFCLMGACQDCWVWTPAGERLRACTTSVAAGMEIRTAQPEGTWPSRG